MKGIETDIEWAATENLTLTAGVALLDPKLSADFCEQLDDGGNPLPKADCPSGSFAADGTTLPTTPKFKANMTGRYTFNVADFDAHLQGSFVYQGKSRSALLPYDTGVIGNQPAYGLVDLSTGIARDNYSIELFVTNVFDERAAIPVRACGRDHLQAPVRLDGLAADDRHQVFAEILKPYSIRGVHS